MTVGFPGLRKHVERLGLEFFGMDPDGCRAAPAKDTNGETANSG
jgi:hypothetical protein